MHFIACTCQPFSVVEHPTFTSLLSSDPSGLKDRQHYSDRVMPRVYDGAKNAVKEKLSKCGTLSFTSDIWTNQSSGFISLTAHGINEYWQREQFIACITTGVCAFVDSTPRLLVARVALLESPRRRVVINVNPQIDDRS
uniref:Uncharacterized protein n=1 Tax=Ditylenchus dipsaci TaxID=166011 RepID=A0A915CV99_9BILA